VAVDLGETTVTRRVLSERPDTPGNRAMLAVLDGDFEGAAQWYGEAGIALFEAESRLRHAEHLIGNGHRDAGAVELERALDFYRHIGASLFVERGERLLAETATG